MRVTNEGSTVVPVGGLRVLTGPQPAIPLCRRVVGMRGTNAGEFDSVLPWPLAVLQCVMP
jgi:hypothetical protein